ncbi:unnamed protein product [Linum trigynum]|uniref:Uncharacterized protein n=1 Tax=Linum trigynum TaxID=586398 RepID=A0AAV2CCK5_9ROSI
MRELGRWIRFHNCFARRALLKPLRSRKPMPPSSFELAISSLRSPCALVSGALYPHQKFITIVCTSSRVPSGIMNIDIA